ncbi:MAG: ATP-binding protein [Novosphingobium sp.]
MYGRINDLVEWFIPDAIRANEADLPMVRNFVLLHLLGPLMGHAVTGFLWLTLKDNHWQFWFLEGIVASFFLIPLILRHSRSLYWPAMISVQSLVAVSLFGSFYFGGISSPLLPWFLIAMVLGFFYLAESTSTVLALIGVQLMLFFGFRIWLGDFPRLMNPADLVAPNALSILAATTYMTLLCLFYEGVMRVSLRMEQEAIDQRCRVAMLREAMHAAEQASRHKSIFLAKMSHELRTPLNAVIGYTEMLREIWEERGDGERKAKDLDRIHAAGRHLLALVNDVIDLSSIESDKIELNVEPVAVIDLVEEVVSTASPLARKRENRLVLNVPEDIGVCGLDALKIRQCLLNLLGNSAKFTTKGMIMLTVLRNTEADGDWLSFEVTDNGVGMRPDALERIFETFSQAENDTVSRFGGTGLGLTLTRRFVEMMDGTIMVRSEYGVGSGFTIRIPVAAALPVDPAHAAQPSVAA